MVDSLKHGMFLGGLGQGLAAGTSQMLQAGLTVRDQNMKMKLGVAQLTVQMKRLAEERRQANLTHRRFYDGLKHDDLKQTRDHAANKRLRQMADDAAMNRQKDQQTFMSEEAVVAHTRAMEVVEAEGIVRLGVAQTTAAPRHRANELVQRQQDFDLIPQLQGEASVFINQMAMGPDGMVTPESFERRAAENGFLLANGQGDPAAYSMALYEEFNAGVRGTYGPDTPAGSPASWQGAVHGAVLADAAGTAAHVKAMELEYQKTFLVLPAQQAAEATLYSFSGEAKFPMTMDAAGDVYYDGGNATELDAVLGEYGKKLAEISVSPTGSAADGMTVESWFKDFSLALGVQTGLNITDLGPDQRRNMKKQDLLAFEGYFKNVTGMKFPTPLSGYGDRTDHIYSSMMKNSSGLVSSGADGAGDLPAGTSVRDQRQFGTFATRTNGAIADSRIAFSRAAKVGDMKGMFEEISYSTRQYKKTLEQMDQFPSFANGPSIKGSMEEWATMLDTMAQTMQMRGAIDESAGQQVNLAPGVTTEDIDTSAPDPTEQAAAIQRKVDESVALRKKEKADALARLKAELAGQTPEDKQAEIEAFERSQLDSE